MPQNNYSFAPSSAQEWLKEAIRKSEASVINAAMAKAQKEKEAATHNVPAMKIEQADFNDAHTWLSRETRADPVDVDQDVASHDWTNWEVKKEPITKFLHLNVHSHAVIDLDSPSPQQKKRKVLSQPSAHLSSSSTSKPSMFVPNPENAELGLEDSEDGTLEVALEREMDRFQEGDVDALPAVGDAPDAEEAF